MITLPITVFEAQQLLLVSIRLAVILFMLPFFDSSFIPKSVKFPLVIILSLVVVYYVKIPTQSIPSFSVGAFILIIVQEVLYGLTIGICTKVIFTAIRLALEFINVQIGFSMATVIDPTSGINEGAITSFFYLLSLVFFVLFNGHIIFIRSLMESFFLLPVGEFVITPRIAQDVLKYMSTIFYLGLKISSPVITAILLVTLAMALVGKAVPTMNLMLFAFPIKIAIGFLFLLLLAQLLAMEIEQYTGTIFSMITSITKMVSVK